jgi:transcription initiation factor IIE alpha subunit
MRWFEMEEKDYIDITPRGVDKGTGQSGRSTTVFQESEWKTILENPGRLTSEGIDKKLEIWKASSNKHIQILYSTMKARCKKVAPSGKTEDGRTIYSRKEDGTPHWCEGRGQKVVKEKEEKIKNK